MMDNNFKAGRYYIGDLCYVIHNDLWSEVCDKHFNGDESFLIRGNKMFMAGTAYGDGSYDVLGADGVCSVDSGTIGCIRLGTLESSLVLKPDLDESDTGGIIVVFDKDFEAECIDGMFTFGNITVDTKNDDDDDDDDWIDSWADSYSDEDEEEDWTGTNNGDEIV